MSINLQSDFDVRSDFQSDLLPDENVIWAGAPDSGFFLNSTGIVRIIAGVITVGFFIFWVKLQQSMVLHQGYAPDPVSRLMPFLGIPFILSGVFSIVAPFTYDRWKRSNTRYAVTNKRILFLAKKPSRALYAASLKDILSVESSVYSSGLGAVNFRKHVVNRSSVVSFCAMGYHICSTFEYIRDADMVCTLVSDLISGKTQD